MVSPDERLCPRMARIIANGTKARIRKSMTDSHASVLRSIALRVFLRILPLFAVIRGQCLSLSSSHNAVFQIAKAKTPRSGPFPAFRLRFFAGLRVFALNAFSPRRR